MVSVTDCPPLVSASDGVLDTCRFGFFGVTDAADLSEPDFLSLTVAVDFLPPAPLDVSLLAPVPSSPADAEDCDDSGDAGDEGDWVLESDAGDEPVDESVDDAEELDDDALEDEESDDELVDEESVGPAHATPGVVAIATPTPKATAKPPTRPTYVAYPITIPPRYRRETAAGLPRPSSAVQVL